MRILAALIAILIGTAVLSVAMVMPVGGAYKAGPTVKVMTPGGHGSGVHIGNGYFLTAAHVVKGKPSVQIKFDDGSVYGDVVEIMWASDAYDIALIRIGKFHNIETRSLSCDPPLIGDEISAAGNPMEMEFVTHYGRVGSSVQVVYWPPFSGLVRWPAAVVVDAGLVPGMSGGPIFNQDGDVAGIIVGRVPGESLFFAVPGSVACDLMGRA